MVSLGMNNFINAQGFGKMGMLTVLLGAVMNIILDPVLIFGFDMGVRGAAIATVISQGASALWVFTFLTGRRALFKLTRESMRLKVKLVHVTTCCRQCVAAEASRNLSGGTEPLIMLDLIFPSGSAEGCKVPLFQEHASYILWREYQRLHVIKEVPTGIITAKSPNSF